jgi:hypothetical protein
LLDIQPLHDVIHNYALGVVAEERLPELSQNEPTSCSPIGLSLWRRNPRARQHYDALKLENETVGRGLDLRQTIQSKMERQYYEDDDRKDPIPLNYGFWTKERGKDADLGYYYETRYNENLSDCQSPFKCWLGQWKSLVGPEEHGER